MTFLSKSRINFVLTARPDVFEDHIKQFWATTEHDREGEKNVATNHDQEIIIDEAKFRRVLRFGDDQEGALVFSGNHVLDLLRAFGYEG